MSSSLVTADNLAHFSSHHPWRTLKNLGKNDGKKTVIIIMTRPYALKMMNTRAEKKNEKREFVSSPAGFTLPTNTRILHPLHLHFISFSLCCLFIVGQCKQTGEMIRNRYSSRLWSILLFSENKQTHDGRLYFHQVDGRLMILNEVLSWLKGSLLGCEKKPFLKRDNIGIEGMFACSDERPLFSPARGSPTLNPRAFHRSFLFVLPW